MTRELVQALEARTALLRGHAAEADRACRLPEAVVHALRELDLFRLWVPRRYGGRELALPDALGVYESAARIDGSVGWAVMIGAGGGLFAPWLDEQAAQAIFARPDAVIAGSGAPEGRADKVPGGYRVSGRWRYASGAHYATTFTANCVLHEGGEALRDGEGRPLIRAMAFEPSQVRILPTWNPGGMRGTGSHDFEVEDAFVPEARSFSLFTDTPRLSTALTHLPFAVLTELPVISVALGIAAHALESFATLARGRPGAEPARRLADESWLQSRYAECHARWEAVRAQVHELARELADVQGTPSPATQARVTAACATGVADLVALTGSLAAAAGMAATAMEHEFARAWRDLQTLAAHASVSPARLATAGQALLQSGSPYPS